MANQKDRQLEAFEHSLITGRIGRRTFVRGALATGVLAISGVQALADELDAIRANQDKRRASLGKSYDYIVVGTGSSGCSLVGALAKNSSAKILVIEAGDWDTAPSVQDPRVWFTNLGTERDWGDAAIPSAGVNSRSIPEHTGRVVGGGSSINATIWARPFKADLDHWASESGDDKWSYDHGLEIFKRVENWQGTPNEKFRGKGGPVWVQPAADPLPLASSVLEGCREVNLPVVDDLNGDREITGNGFGYMNQIIKDGRRQNMARAFLYPVLGQENVTLLINTQVNRIVLDGDRAVAVECVHQGQPLTVAADREIILAAGGFNTPKLLMLSGIGDEADLKAVDLKTLVSSPEVGKNVQDHILHGGCLYEAPAAFEYKNSAANISGYYKTDSSLELPDVSIVQIEIPYASEVIAKQYAPPPTSWALCAGLVTPKSRGTVKLKSSNSDDRPVVDMQFLSHPDDVKTLSNSIDIARSIANSSAMKPFVVREVAPGKKLEGEALATFVRDGATTYFHSSGACRMGKDDKAVVDSQLRVNGVRNLRIADSTIMPRIVAVPTMPACVLIGQRMAEILAA
ncbi:GMC family oxidoreductase [Mesorhizobium sp. B2-5-7]|uniref:GMC family oxidoreductase n=1 Tax=Mesorhizobium sp. B2-5-7 TaxID=2589923 RepID=UPI00112A3E17|nr:GMC family oxidoreductase [Mesorhizobium sp. B2-5-7]TPK10123.1 GMC family oxidoreductase [Mesorhizobium sp. B2-5-7]